MTNRNFAILVVASVFVGLATAASANPALSKVSIAEGSASFVDVDRIGGPSALASGLKKMTQCVQAVDAATQAGLKPSTETKVDDSKRYPNGRRVKKPGYTAKHYAPLNEIRAGCEAKFATLRVLPARWSIDEVQDHAAALARRTKPDIHAGVPAQLAYDKCVKRVKQSLQLGAPPETVIKSKTLTVTLGEAEAKGCGVVLPVIAAAKAKADGAKSAKYAPYRKVLRGDKWRTFKNKKMMHFKVYGRGGKYLSTPRAFANSSVWFERLRSGSYRSWAMRRYKFNRKNRLVSKRTITGRGRIPPSRAYR
jgi:hypothetical protein